MSSKRSLYTAPLIAFTIGSTASLFVYFKVRTLEENASTYAWEALALGVALTFSAVVVHFLLRQKATEVEALVRERTQALRHSEAQLKEAQSIAKLGNWSLNLLTNELHWSDEVFKLFEIDSEEFPASYEGFLNAIHPEDRDFVNQSYNNSLENRTSYNIVHRLLMKDGRIKHVREICHTNYAKDGTPLSSHGVIQDITETWEVQEKLNESERRFRQMVEQSPFSIQLLSPEGITLSVNKAWSDLWGVPFEALENYNLRQDPQLEEKGVKPYIDRAFAGETVDIPPIEYNADETESVEGGSHGKWVRAYIYPIKNEHEELTQVVIMHQDETEFRRNYLRMQQLSLVVEQANDSIVITDTAGKIQYVNPAFEKLSGYSFNEARGNTMRLVRSGVHPKEKYEELWKILHADKIWRGSFTNINKSGRQYIIEQVIVPIFDDKHRKINFLGIQRDVTRERAEQASRQHTQHLESLGALAGGIAHDFNNLLTVILGSTNLVERVLGEEHPMTFHLNQASESAQTAGKLCNQMLAYSGQGNYVIESFYLAHILSEMSELLHASLSPQCKLLLDSSSSPCMIKGDISQIKQLILALLLNASEAIGETKSSGTIHILTQEKTMEAADFEGSLSDNPMKPGHYSCLQVEDTGCGMSAETLEKIFEPFYTTKFTGRGMGLSAVLGIIRSHNGAIHVTSSLGRGTMVRLFFPRDDMESETSKL